MKEIAEEFVAKLQAEGATTVTLFVGTPGDVGRIVYAPSREDIGSLLLVMAQTANELVKAAQDAGEFDAMAADATGEPA